MKSLFSSRVNTLRFFERFLSIKQPTQLLTKTAKLRVNRLIGFPFVFIPVERQLKKLINKRSKNYGINCKKSVFSKFR